MKSSFAHLRVSSEYSIFKGLLSVEKLVEKAKSFGMPAISINRSFQHVWSRQIF